MTRTYVEIEFEKGDAVAVMARSLVTRQLLTKLNQLGGKPTALAVSIWWKIAYVGMKSRGIYETPGGTLLLAAHRGD